MRPAILAVTMLALAATEAAAQTGIGPGGSGVIPGGPAPLGVPGAQIGQAGAQQGRFQAVRGPGGAGQAVFLVIDTVVGNAWALMPGKDANQPYNWVAIGGPNLTPVRPAR
jgi:hypothetical protein